MKETFSSSAVLVTGGAGYIGSHTCKALKQHGFIPVVVDNFANSTRDAVRYGPYEEADIRDSDRLVEIFQRYKPIAVLHFAGYAYVEESVRDSFKYYQNNVLGSFSLVEAMRRAECHNLIFSSTCAVYGEPEVIPISENSAREPVNPYGRTKKIVEDVLIDLDRSEGFSSVILRYFNAAGADPEGELGECHDPETHLIPLCLAAAAAGSPIDVFGTDYPTRDGSCIRDYIHVTDLAEAHVAALRYLLREKKTAVYNLGSGVGASVLEIVETVREVTGKLVTVRLAKRRPGDPASLLANSEKARRELDWQPKYTDIRSIVKHAWRWHEQRQNTEYLRLKQNHASLNH